MTEFLQIDSLNHFIFQLLFRKIDKSILLRIDNLKLKNKDRTI